MPRPFISSRLKRIAVGVVAVAAIGLAGTTLALAASHRHFVNPFTSVSYTDNTTGAVVAAVQNGTGVGVEGITGNSNGSIGVLGFQDNNATNGVAMEGLVWGKSSTGLYGQALHNADTTHPSVGLLGTSSSGIGVDGESLVATGIGTFGTAADGLSSGSLGIGTGAGVLGTTARGSFMMPGVEGESTDQTGGDAAGVFGLRVFFGDAAPTFGVLSYGSASGIRSYALGSGASSTNNGVLGVDDYTASFPDLNAGINGSSSLGTGVLAQSGGATPNIVFGAEPIGEMSVSGVGGTGAFASIASFNEAVDTSTFALVGYDSSSGNELDMVTPAGNILAGFGSGSEVITVDSSGNENITGILTTAGVCSSGCIASKGHTAKRVITYAAQSSEPTVEDFGEGQIVSGIGHVQIDPAFGRTIDARKAYMVFLTPEGDNRGLYVTQRTPAGFTVREAQGGTSTLGFMYRVVAKPYGVNAARLPMVDVSGGSARRAVTGPSRHVPQPLDPYAALVKAIGPARAAQMLAQAKAAYLSRQRMILGLPHVDSAGNLHAGAAIIQPPHR